MTTNTAQLKIAVVEDDRDLAEEVQFHLQKAGLIALHAANSSELNEILTTQDIDVIVLDLGLPDEDGLSIARRLSGLPGMRIVMLTARTSVLDRIQGFDSGADVYLTKPVNMQELVRVILSAARRLPPKSEALVLNTKRGELRKGSLVVELTGLEVDFMRQLVSSEGIRLTKVEAERAIYSAGDTTAHRKLEVMLSRLRTKLKDAGLNDLVRTDWGRGFVLTEKVVLEQ